MSLPEAPPLVVDDRGNALVSFAPGVIGGISPEPAEADLARKWAVDYWDALHPHSMGGGYVKERMQPRHAHPESSTDASGTSTSGSTGLTRSPPSNTQPL